MNEIIPIPAKHVVQDFNRLIGRIEGLSERQLRAHLGLYEGYVKKINELDEKLARVPRAAPSYSFAECSELMRRRAVPYNGAVLHELYFGALGGPPGEAQGELRRQLARDFGSMENWWNDACAGLSSADGWLLLTRSFRDGRLRNCVIEEHHRGLLAEQHIVLALDGWEHAYMVDYATDKREYLRILERAIDWQVATRRFEEPVRAARAA